MADDKIRPELLRPVAGPVDTYGGPKKSSLASFAEGLSHLDSGLSEFINNRAEEFRKQEAIRGEAAFHENNAEGYAEAVRKGLIPAQASKTFMRSYKYAQGQLAGQRLQGAWAAAYNAWDGKYSEDPKAFDEFLGNFVKENIGTDDPDILAGVMPQVRQLTANAQAKHTSDLSTSLYNGSLNTHVAEANAAIDEANEQGLADGTGTGYPALFAAIETKREGFIASGGDPADFDKAMVDAMSAKILATRDPGLLAWFDQKVPGQEYTYGASIYGQKVKEQTVNALEVIARRNEADDAEKAKDADKKAKEQAEREAIEVLSKDPSAAIPDDLMARGVKHDPQFKVHVEQWRKSLGEGFTDPDKLNGVYQAIMDGGGFKAVQDAMHQGVFGRPEDLTAAYNFAKSFEDNKARIDDALGSGVAKNVLEAIDVRTKGVDSTMRPLQGMSNEGFEATYDFRRAVQEWIIKNPDAGVAETQEAIAKIGKTILDHIPPTQYGTPGTYDRPGGAPFDNPYTDGPPPAAQQPQQTEAPAKEGGNGELPTIPSVIPDGVTGGGVVVPGSDLTPEQSQAVDDLAKTRGVTREQILNEMGIQPISYRPDGEPQGGDRREAEFTFEQASAFLEQAMADGGEAAGASPIEGDPVAGRLAALTREHEAAGNYNAVYGNSRSKVALSKYTVADILGIQLRAIRNGSPSSAIGAYQILRGTLMDAMKGMGLTGKERFTPKLQDRIFMWLINRRGYQAFKAGRISKRQFALRLSQEWASLPNPGTGRSYYAGDGLNAASASRSEVYRALGIGA